MVIGFWVLMGAVLLIGVVLGELDVWYERRRER